MDDVFPLLVGHPIEHHQRDQAVLSEQRLSVVERGVLEVSQQGFSHIGWFDTLRYRHSNILSE